jgi:hypothetical protein
MTAFLPALRTALERDLVSDLFVIRSTVAHLVLLMEYGDYEYDILATALDELNAFFDSDAVLSFQLDVLFVSGKECSVYNRNMNSLLSLKNKLEKFLEQKKRPEGL